MRKRNKQQSKRRYIKSKSFIKIPWKSKPKTFSLYPYIIIVSFFRRNLFLNLTDLKGQTKIWINAGQCGFSGRAKVAYMASVSIMQNFIQRIWKYGARVVILKFKNGIGPRRSIKRAIVQNRILYKFRFISFVYSLKLAFNGCRHKKKRRR
jgi:ribosomal protein S11